MNKILRRTIKRDHLVLPPTNANQNNALDLDYAKL